MVRRLVALAFVVLALMWISPLATAQPPGLDKRASPRTSDIKVLVLNFDPVVAAPAKTRLHEHCRWQDPRVLAKGYVDDLGAASGGRIRYQIVEWQDLDEFPIKADGFTYTLEEYLKCHQSGQGWHQPDGADYPQVIAKHRIAQRIDQGEIDEVWWFGGPYFGFFESAMAGRGAFYINGGVFGPDKVPSQRAFAIMGYNYERGVAEMLHNLSHRTESTMSRVFGGWKAETLDHDWARFAANFKQSGGVAAVGSCHYPPNGESDYDYANKRFVESSADDWLEYPNLTRVTKKVNCETWGGPDFHRNYMKWWFARLPRAPGVNVDHGRLNDWWEYVFNFNAYDDRGRAAR